MNDQPDQSPATDETEYIPDPEKEKQAKAVHFTIGILRLLGAIIAVLGITIAAGRFPQVPIMAGYVLIFIGLGQMWFLPLWIIRRYVKARVAEEEIAASREDKDAEEKDES